MLTEQEIEAALDARSTLFPYSVRTILSTHGVSYPSQAAAVMEAALEAAASVRPDRGEAVAWLCYGAADGQSGDLFATVGEKQGHVIRPGVDRPLYLAPPKSYEDGVKVADVEVVVTRLLDMEQVADPSMRREAAVALTTVFAHYRNALLSSSKV